jgi:hypothetical protein
VLVSLGSPSHRDSPRLYPPKPRHSLANLLVNHESRAIFLEHYERIFKHTETTKPRGRGCVIYFSFEKDSLCVGSGLRVVRYLLGRFPEEMVRIRYLDVNLDTHANHAGRYLLSWATVP